jgi:hypothetical protein
VPFITAIVLFWQRRRLVPLLRRGWATLRSTATQDAAGTGTLGRLAVLARRALVGGWRTVDTDANANRLARFVGWMRTFAAGNDVVRPAAKTETAA